MLLKDDGVLNAKSEDDEVVQLGIKSLFQKANVRTITIVLFICWTLVTLGYYGVSLSSGNLSDDIFVNYLLISLIGEKIREKYTLQNIFGHRVFFRNPVIRFLHIHHGPLGTETTLCCLHVVGWDFHTDMRTCRRGRAEDRFSVSG